MTTSKADLIAVVRSNPIVDAAFQEAVDAMRHAVLTRDVDLMTAAGALFARFCDIVSNGDPSPELRILMHRLVSDVALGEEYLRLHPEAEPPWH